MVFCGQNFFSMKGIFLVLPIVPMVLRVGHVFSFYYFGISCKLLLGILSICIVLAKSIIV